MVAVGVIGIILALIGIVSDNPNGNGANQTEILLAEPVSDADWFKGGKDSRAVLVEYSDFQCPACAHYSEMLQKLAQDFGGNLKIVYRHYPLPQHQNAKAAASAAEAAGRQGKFWEMHDLIFKNQNRWSDIEDADKEMAAYARELNLDADKFSADLKLKEIESKINADLASGNRSGVRATPTFFLGGKQIKNPSSYDEFKALVEKELGNI